MNYDEWINEIFDHEPVDSFMDIEWSESQEIWDTPEREKLQFVVELFESSRESLTRFSDAQVAVGLNFLTNEIEDSFRGIYNVSIPDGERVAAVKSIYSLFRDCLAERCENSCTNDSKNPLNSYCYMFWDASQISLYGFAVNPDDRCREELIETMIEVLGKTLALPNAACKESALHGLGHSIMSAGSFLQKEYKKQIKQQIEKIIDTFIRDEKPKGRLLTYAREAKTGIIL